MNDSNSKNCPQSAKNNSRVTTRRGKNGEIELGRIKSKDLLCVNREADRRVAGLKKVELP